MDAPSRSSLPFVDLVLAPVRLAVDVAQAIPRIADGLENLGSVLAALDRIAESTQSLGALADAVDQLERAASELTHAVQPLQNVAQRLSRLGRRGDERVP